jgi:hypothetical protein
VSFELPQAKAVEANPTQEQMRDWALELMDNITETEFRNLNYKARILARMAPSTFFVSDTDPGKQSLPRACTTSGPRSRTPTSRSRR